MPGRKAPTLEELAALRHHGAVLRRSAGEPPGPMTVTSPCNAFLVRGLTELAYEVRGHASAIDAWVEKQEPKTGGRKRGSKKADRWGPLIREVEEAVARGMGIEKVKDMVAERHGVHRATLDRRCRERKSRPGKK
jgi:hypothetical protein